MEAQQEKEVAAAVKHLFQEREVCATMGVPVDLVSIFKDVRTARHNVDNAQPLTRALKKEHNDHFQYRVIVRIEAAAGRLLRFTEQISYPVRVIPEKRVIDYLLDVQKKKNGDEAVESRRELSEALDDELEMCFLDDLSNALDFKHSVDTSWHDCCFGVPSGKRFFMYCTDFDLLRLWNAETGKSVRRYPNPNPNREQFYRRVMADTREQFCRRTFRDKTLRGAEVLIFLLCCSGAISSWGSLAFGLGLGLGALIFGLAIWADHMDEIKRQFRTRTWSNAF